MSEPFLAGPRGSIPPELYRRLQELQRKLEELEARIAALEP